MNKLELLKETILLGESIITETKKIGIDKLPYGFDSLTRFIDEKTMNVHYNKHYKGYVKKLNDALSKKDYGNVELEDIVKSISKFPKVIRNNGGGAFNHSLFWKMLSKEKQKPSGEILTKINKEFGSYNEFKKKFEEEATNRFGSGWVWLVLTKNNRLKIMSTPNQDNPLMNIVDGGGYPLLGLDLWEHAYYLEYQNEKDQYIKKFWDVVNWEYVNEIYKSQLKVKLRESIKTTKTINENFVYNSTEDFGNDFKYIKDNGRINPKVFDKMLPKVYPPCSPEIITNYNKDTRITTPCFGKIKTNECETSYGVIGGKYAVSQRGGIGEWSVINWFDANTKVSDKILEYFEKFNKEGLDFISWFFKLKKTLLSDDGKFTGELADFIMNPQTKKGTLDYGSKRENLAIELLNSKYKNLDVLRYCDGDTRDKFNGQDMMVTQNGVSKHIQVKPTTDLLGTTINGQTFYVFKSKNKYTTNNIQIFAFIKNDSEYIFFDFESSKVEIKDNGNQSKERYSYIFDPSSIKFKSNNLYLSKINLTESMTKKELLNEAKSNFPNYRSMRSMIQSVYLQNKCNGNNWVDGCFGNINIPECGDTNNGIIGGKYTEGQYGGKGLWSLINRWDANGNVHSEIEKIYKEEVEKFKIEKNLKRYSLTLTDWIENNKFKLFSNDGEWVDRLAKVSIENFQKGLENEEYGRELVDLAFDLDKYKQDIDYKISFNCGGSVADTKRGQDIVLKFNDEQPIHFQIKSIKDGYVKLFNSDRGKYYRVASWYEHTKYKEENVDLIVYVNKEKKEYIIFENDYSKIVTTPNSNFRRNNDDGDITIPNYIYYYEEPFRTNITNLELIEPKRKITTNPRLQRKKEELINQYKEKIKLYQDKLKELGIDDVNIIESIIYYKNKLNSLLYS